MPRRPRCFPLFLQILHQGNDIGSGLAHGSPFFRNLHDLGRRPIHLPPGIIPHSFNGSFDLERQVLWDTVGKMERAERQRNQQVNRGLRLVS
jgi:hypothetical protein